MHFTNVLMMILKDMVFFFKEPTQVKGNWSEMVFSYSRMDTGESMDGIMLKN